MKNIKTFVYAILAGVFIAIGGTVFLSVENTLVGSLLFTVGLFVICTFNYNLFTGKVCYAFNNDKKYVISLIIIWIGNLIGSWGSASIINMTRLSQNISDKAKLVSQVKLDDTLLSIFILSILCNVLIYIAVEGFKKNPHELGKYLSIFFGVVVFILCGFEHCVANMFYISLSGLWTFSSLLFIFINTLGNTVGGLLLPVLKKYAT